MKAINKSSHRQYQVVLTTNNEASVSGEMVILVSEGYGKGRVLNPARYDLIAENKHDKKMLQEFLLQNELASVIEDETWTKDTETF